MEALSKIVVVFVNHACWLFKKIFFVVVARKLLRKNVSNDKIAR